MLALPADGLIVSDNSSAYDQHIQASLAANRSFALIYSAGDTSYSIDLSQLHGKKWKAAWYDPKTDRYQRLNKTIRPNKNQRLEVDPPGASGPGNDWILMIGDRAFDRSMIKPFLP